ncbi:STAS domain-containing protein [Salinibacterium sp. SYSU T00001]|uniref:STAS domain-containing protein n=1 Tax=Homoserinimonas sedimenticola TaxID=2986805 RepID=UPI002236B638|nr:STAS domain-containing protein [Salinibacterium sedimenticola]MCW4386098.1 STAS domain-containing protein [Salinibacterium sedimenticola]
MEFEERTRGTASVLAPRGKLNLVTAPAVKAKIDELVASGSPRIVVDLSEVTFMDSSGLGALIGSLKSARQAGGDMRIAAAGEQVRAVLKLTNLDRILAPHDTVEDASRGW